MGKYNLLLSLVFCVSANSATIQDFWKQYPDLANNGSLRSAIVWAAGSLATQEALFSGTDMDDINRVSNKLMRENGYKYAIAGAKNIGADKEIEHGVNCFYLQLDKELYLTAKNQFKPF